jgi:C1A family cysteine protease
MKWLPFLSCGVFLLLIAACQHDLSCEGCVVTPPNSRDTLPANYPFANGFCNGVFLGLAIPPHDSARYSETDILPDSLFLDMPAAGDQGSQGSCSAWATVYGAGSYYNHILTGAPYTDSSLLSPNYTYNQITKGNCTCTSIFDHLYLLETQGACSLKAMPYNAAECVLQPDSVQMKKAVPFKIRTWQTVDLTNRALIKQQLLHKSPVLFATYPDEGFKRPLPPYIISKRVGPAPSGHAMVICGYNNAKKAFRVMNSWGKGWADNGFAWIDYDFFVQNLADMVGAVIIY